MKIMDSEKKEVLIVIAKRNTHGVKAYQVLDEDMDTPYWLERGALEIVDPKAADRWITVSSGFETLSTFPEFAKKGFWEAFFAGDETAVENYNKVIVPLNHVAIDESHIDNPLLFSWSNVLFLMNQRMLSAKAAVNLAVERVDAGNESPEELELSGLSYRESDEIQRLVAILASKDSIDAEQLLTAGIRAVKESKPTADVEIFKERFSRAIAEIE